MLIEIKITGTAITAQYGSLVTGDILRCEKAFADHLVNDCHVAEYIINDAEPEEILDVKPTKSRTKR